MEHESSITSSRLNSRIRDVVMSQTSRDFILKILLAYLFSISLQIVFYNTVYVKMVDDRVWDLYAFDDRTAATRRPR